MQSRVRGKSEGVGVPRPTCDYPKALPVMPHSTLRMSTRTSCSGELYGIALTFQTSPAPIDLLSPKKIIKKPIDSLHTKLPRPHARALPRKTNTHITCPHARPAIASWILQRQSACFSQDVRSRYGHNARSHQRACICHAVVYRVDSYG